MGGIRISTAVMWRDRQEHPSPRVEMSSRGSLSRVDSIITLPREAGDSQGRGEVEGQWCRAGDVSAMLAWLFWQTGLFSLLARLFSLLGSLKSYIYRNKGKIDTYSIVRETIEYLNTGGFVDLQRFPGLMSPRSCRCLIAAGCSLWPTDNQLKLNHKANYHVWNTVITLGPLFIHSVHEFAKAEEFGHICVFLMNSSWETFQLQT